MSKRVLIITRHYLDAINGGANCSRANIRALSELYSDCALIYPEHDEKASVNYIPKSIKAFPCYDHRNIMQKGLDVYRGKLNRTYHFVKEHLEKYQYDIVFFDHSLTSNGIIENVKKQGCKIVTIHHNNETQYLRDNKPFILYRWPFTYYAEKAESEALLLSDMNLTLTEKDAREFRERYLEMNIHCYNMGTFQYQNLPAKIKDDGIRACQTFAITGSMNFQQSQRPVLEFVERYLPILLRKIPQAKLIIAGREPSMRIQEMCSKHPEIKLIPNPADMEEVISQADIYICPTDMGSGVKLRVMDGLKIGIPVLGHSVALNGYESIKADGFFFDFYDEPSFELALERIVNLNYKKQQVYESFLSYFSFEAGKRRLQEILQKEDLL